MRIGELIEKENGRNYDLHRQYVNPAFVRVLRIIGYDKVYAKGEGAYLYDEDGNEYLDFLGGYNVLHLGRNNKRINKVLSDL